ncbi:uncharacterized protein LOC141841246 [Curcuma longa]|uniref:uncharacterized protein LOC141841246 n=1 Tax=Curcuma longa TaxID=136217 RepID=UPI003D9E6080
MAINGVSQPLIPIFKGECYEFWSIKMKTLFRSQDLWDLVEKGFDDEDADESRLKENRKKDSKALFILQQAKEFQGSSRVIAVKLQTLRSEFEALLMKVLRSLTPKYDYIVTAIEEAKDLSVFSFDELMGSLQAHEARRTRSVEKNDEKTFQVKGEIEKKEDFVGRGCGRGGFRGRGRGRGRSNFDRQFNGDQKWNKNSVQCYGCKRFGHIKTNCRNSSQANYVQEGNEESKLFMVHSNSNEVQNDIWFLDSGCSNHMTGNKSLFKELDESQKMLVRLGDNKQIQVEGKDTIAVETSNGKVKLLYNVYFVPNLAHSLLSVGQLMMGGYAILFDNGACVITDKDSGQSIVNVQMTENKMFPLKISNVGNQALIASEDE